MAKIGCIYKRGNVYWIKYYRSGKPYYESTKSRKEADAKRLLKKREGEISDGKLPGIYFDKVTFDELSEAFLSDYRTNQQRSLKRAEIVLMRKQLSLIFNCGWLLEGKGKGSWTIEMTNYWSPAELYQTIR